MRKSAAALAFAFIALAVGALLSPARADNFPSRPITLIVPFPPGGSTDVAARFMADKMGGALGQHGDRGKCRRRRRLDRRRPARARAAGRRSNRWSLI